MKCLKWVIHDTPRLLAFKVNQPSQLEIPTTCVACRRTQHLARRRSILSCGHHRGSATPDR